ncbi:hypothetical protein LINPERPRIM_LOCUS30323 [Linum perenne]
MQRNVHAPPVGGKVSSMGATFYYRVCYGSWAHIRGSLFLKRPGFQVS